MTEKCKVLVVDDEEVDRAILNKILEGTYEVIEAFDGQEAMGILARMQNQISAVILDLIGSQSSGYDFMRLQFKGDSYCSIPVVVVTADATASVEREYLKLGASDVVHKPYDPDIVRFRIRNAIEHSQFQISKELKYRAEFDLLTGIYNKEKMFQATERLLALEKEVQFAFVRLDIEKFQLINSFFGMANGDHVLKYIADMLREYAAGRHDIVYGRMEADVFGICMPYEDENQMIQFVSHVREVLNQYPLEFDIVPTVGIYVIDHNTTSPIHMYDRANLAAKHCKGNYIYNYAFYTKEMSEEIVKEQRIVNSMKLALEQEQFVLYLQPKYELQRNIIAGAEILIRWKKPGLGMISPGEFIPVFERNGFISKLDYYVWDKTCQLLRKWIDEAKHPSPVSVNISRVSLYNSKLVELICELTQKYDIPRSLLQLELTESAYTSNPKAIQDTMDRFQQEGFSILMDDFGSGYSSLNVLKDIAVDILKIDMKFLSDTDKRGRSQNILASVVRMAKWLNMPVVAEGVEREEQVAFLRSIGCEYVQGFYFARPMSIEDYEKIAFEEPFYHDGSPKEDAVSVDNLWDSTSQMEILFSNMLQAVAVYEYEDGKYDIIRVNDAYYDLFGYSDMEHVHNHNALTGQNKTVIMQAFHDVVENRKMAECEFLRELESGRQIWIFIRLKYINQVGSKHIIYGSLQDITSQKEMDWELQKYRTAMSVGDEDIKTLLVVDDMEVNRACLKSIFEAEYNILEAQDGKEALEILANSDYRVNLILLDIMMPVMDGPAFLACKKRDSRMADIPVIVITSDDTTKRQIQTMQMGADDYIVKPFIPEIATRRVKNVLESSRRFEKILGTEEI